MWANTDVVGFTRWLRSHNLGREPDARVGFYGLDVYSLWESLRSALEYLEAHHPEHVETALEAFRCFEPFAEDTQSSARSTQWVPSGCEREVVDLLGRMSSSGPAGGSGSDAQSNAERRGNYVPTVLNRRYDAFLRIDRSAALEPLHPGRAS